MTCEITRNGHTIRPATRILFGLKNALARLSAWYKARHARAAVRRLAAYDDRMLADVGLDRTDLDAAAQAPWYVDPTVVLAVRRRRRIHAQSAGARVPRARRKAA